MVSCFQISITLLWCLTVVLATKKKPVCPRKENSLSGDFDAVGRFNKIKANSKKTFTISHTHVRSGGKEETYTYAIKFCSTGNIKDTDAVVQREKDNENSNKGLGKFINGTIIGGEDWLLLIYTSGDKYHTFCHKAQRETWISIRCEDQGETPTMKLIEESRYETPKSNSVNKCYYLFEYNHPDACNHVQKPKKLSGGAIFLIILVSVFGAYLLFGFLYQRFVARAKGFEQIPNFAFWRKFGNMSADGCDFVCRREERANTYKGMADALDIETSDDEDRDDGLLPM